MEEIEQINYPEIFKVKNFMVGGLVGYSDVDDGTYLLKKETLDKMLPTIVGKPFIVGHQRIDKNNISQLRKGTVINAEFNAETGQYDCDILVEDEEVLRAIKGGDDKVSSAYQVTDFGQGGRYSGIEYDAEILDGFFTHLALVDNPRYPDGKILINNINDKGDEVMFFRLNKLNEEEVKEQKLNEDDLVEIDGEKVELKDLIDAYKNSCKKNEEDKECEDEEAKDNEEDKEKECEEEAKDNEEEESKENEDSDDELVAKVTAIVKKILEEKDQEEEKKECEEEKTNSISFYPKSRELKNASMSCVAEDCGYMTRAERIAKSNKKYSL